MEIKISTTTETERSLALVVFKNCGTDFLEIVRHKCYDKIAPAAPPKAVAAVLDLEIIPPKWAGLILQFHHRLLNATQVQRLVTAIAGDTKLAQETLSYCSGALTPKQFQQLIDIVATDAAMSHETLLYSPDALTPKQFRQLLNVVTTDVEAAFETFCYCFYKLTPAETQELVDAVASDPTFSRKMLDECGHILTPKQVQLLTPKRRQLKGV